MGCCAADNRGSCFASGSGRGTMTTAEWATPALIVLLLRHRPERSGGVLAQGNDHRALHRGDHLVGHAPDAGGSSRFAKVFSTQDLHCCGDR